MSACANNPVSTVLKVMFFFWINKPLLIWWRSMCTLSSTCRTSSSGHLAWLNESSFNRTTLDSTVYSHLACGIEGARSSNYFASVTASVHAYFLSARLAKYTADSIINYLMPTQYTLEVTCTCIPSSLFISRCQGYSRVIKLIQFLPVYIFIITR